MAYFRTGGRLAGRLCALYLCLYCTLKMTCVTSLEWLAVGCRTRVQYLASTGYLSSLSCQDWLWNRPIPLFSGLFRRTLAVGEGRWSSRIWSSFSLDYVLIEQWVWNKCCEGHWLKSGKSSNTYDYVDPKFYYVADMF